jgi:cobalt-zinc-cadmium resistance protein CzcA
MVNNAIGTVQKNLMEGALIVVFVLVLFLGNLRAGLIVASVIPLSMLFAVILMNIFGVSGNLMSLGAIDFGLIVDGAVIIVEAVMHRLGHSKKFNTVYRLSKEKMDDEVNTSAKKMMNSAVFGQIIILVVYLPIFTLQGIEGKMFKPMAQTVAFALLGAFLLSLTYIPMISSVFLSKIIHHRKNISDRMMEWLERHYQNLLSRIINFPKTILSAACALFVLAIIVLNTLGGEFIPTLEEGDFAVDTRVLTGSSLQTTIDFTQKAAGHLLENFPEVEKVVTKIGSGEVPTDPMPIEASDMMVILKDKKDWTSAKTFNELSEKMSESLKNIPGITTGFQYPVQMRFNELMTGSRQDVVCKIFGENLDSLATYAQKMGKIITTVEGAKDLYIETVTGLPQIIINYNRNALAQYNLNIEDINRIVNTALAGLSSGMLYEGERRFDIVIRLKTSLKKSVEDIQNLLIPIQVGRQIPLYQLAEVAIKDGPNQIQREDAKRRIVVGFNVRGRDVESIVNELQQKTSNQINFSPGYYVTYGGAFENLNEAKKRLMIAVPVSLLLIFLLLYFAFKSIKQGLLIYSAIPLSAIGGIFFLWMRGMPFSISAGIGFIALFGVAVLNGIVLIAEFNRQKMEGVTDLKRIILMGTKIRLRPVLMTAAVASLGFLPMALSNGSGAEVQRPLATVVIGGLLTATFLTLFVLPVLYLMFEKNSSKKMNKQLMTLFVFICLTDWSHAQSPISLNAAIDSAFKNNNRIKNEQLISTYRKQMIQSGAAKPQMMISSETGQYNSKFFDTRLGVSQSFNFPKVYSTQINLLNEEWKSAVMMTAVKKADLKREVSTVFSQLLLIRENEKLLNKIDSLYTEFYRLCELRFQKGESNVLEKTTAETQSGQIKLQLQQLKSDEQLLLLQFQLLLNTGNAFFPAASQFKLQLEQNLFESTQHPVMQMLHQQTKTATAHLKAEQAKLLPDFNIGLFNTSIRGVGADNKTYTAANRFTSMQLGVGIPVLAKGQKARISSSRLMQVVATQQYNSGIQQLENERAQAMVRYQKQSELIRYFETTALKNSTIIFTTATQQFKSGLINYLEWFMLINQAVTIQSEYLNAVSEFNNSIIQLHYFNKQ